MGPYCKYCDMRCFVPRIVPGREGPILLATCHGGMRHDRQYTRGHDHRTTENPVTGEVDIRVQIRTAADERLCETTRCLRPGGSVMIPAGQEFAAVTTREDHHDRVVTLHEQCLTEVFGLVLRQVGKLPAEPGELPVQVVPVAECHECGSRKLDWAWSPHNQGQAVNGRLTLNEVVSLFHLGCAECGATVIVLHPDEVAAILNQHQVRPERPARTATAG